MLVLEWPGLALSANEGESVYIVIRVDVSPDGSIHITGNAYNSLSWEDEYPYPEGFQCDLGENVNMYYASGTGPLLLVHHFAHCFFSHLEIPCFNF